MGQFPISFLLFVSLLSLSEAADYTKLVFRGCSAQKLTDTSSSSTLQAFLYSLPSQSSTVKFNRSTAGDFSGLFQCRSDLSLSDCSNCVDKTPKLALKFCPNSAAARVQLAGCYIRYESSGFGQIPGTQLLYKLCGRGQVSDPGFQARLGSALDEIAKGVGNGTGFYTGDYESVYVLGQCEGDLGNGDCVDCVKSAIQSAESNCGSSVSGQVYLEKCYISYNYSPGGVPYKSNSSAGKGQNTDKLVAIVVGAVAGFGLLITALLFLKSAFKKRDSKY